VDQYSLEKTTKEEHTKEQSNWKRLFQKKVKQTLIHKIKRLFNKDFHSSDEEEAKQTRSGKELWDMCRVKFWKQQRQQNIAMTLLTLSHEIRD